VSFLEVHDLDVRHGLLQAVRGVSLAVEQGETLALVGAHGAGKSTFLRAIAGAPPRPAGGRIVLDGEELSRVRAHARVIRGVALVPEGRHLFPSLTVEENLQVAARRGPWTVASARAISSRVRSSRPSAAARRFATRSRSVVSSADSARSCRSLPDAPTSTFSNTVMSTNGRGI
jgi:ABC-type branched-subunit amino acid transport system ATPase component